MPRYFDTNGTEVGVEAFKKMMIQREKKWKEASEETRPHSFLAVREFRRSEGTTNRPVRISILWMGVVEDKVVAEKFSSMYEIFCVGVEVFANGAWQRDPLVKTFRKRSDADAHFENWVMRFSRSYYNEDGDFVVEENEIVDPNEEISEEEEDKKPKETYKPKTSFGGMVW